MYKILIVEDDMTIAGALAAHLKRWDYDVECVTDFKNIMDCFLRYDPAAFASGHCTSVF